MKQKIFSICAFLSLIGSYDSNAAVNSWYLKDTVKYEHMRITNIFYAPYLHSPRICAFFTAQPGKQNVTGCAVADNSYYAKNNAGTSPFDEIFSTLRYFYATGEDISVYIRSNAFSDFDTSISRNEIVAIGTCNGWCFGETIR
ncbi:pertussis toxin [Salmonella bongori]|uniref:Pertussis toxin n=1 Tax=Salmonella bongori TaxID=54736 RepID=A0A8F8FL59_SALBN|nr:subtilase family AB5 toxin binding subunit [Salmonella bongori]ECG1194496.1 pertussis toxin [Salmonella bongori]EDP8625424.1 pertussis toxin [Salmonella bongori]QXY82689.1 pertussis toxin [Salmonella bongori]